ncbi:cell division protein FtsZ, partial [Peribacillus sp. NPDC058002]
KGSALIGIGRATGKHRAVEAAKKAISSPLLNTSINGAQGVLMKLTDANISFYEVQEAANFVTSAADSELNMIFGSVIDENLKDEIIVIITGLNDQEILSLKMSARPSKAEMEKTLSTEF